MKILISWNDKRVRDKGELFQPMRSQDGSYKMKWKNIVIASSTVSAICDETIDLMKLKHSCQLGKDTQ